MPVTSLRSRGFGKTSWFSGLAAAGAAVALVVSGLAGCSHDTSDDPTGVNDADVTYVSSVVAHHAQSIQLLNLRPQQPTGIQVGLWVDSARMRRLHELHVTERMLRGWDRPVPETGLDHSDEGKHIEFDSDIPGVLPQSRVRTIEVANGDAFTRSWLSALLEHELGAVRLAEAEIAAGQNAETVALAEKDRAAHAAQAERLRRMLRS